MPKAEKHVGEEGLVSKGHVEGVDATEAPVLALVIWGEGGGRGSAAEGAVDREGGTVGEAVVVVMGKAN